MTSALQQNRYDQLIRRVGGIIGPGSKVNEVLSELFPVISLEELPAELLILGGTDICVGAATITGAAGETGRAQVFNPVGSGRILTVEQALISISAGSVIRMATTVTPLATGLGTEVFRDRRRPVDTRPGGQIRSESTVALTDANWSFNALTNTIISVTDPNGLAVLPPGSAFEVGPGTVALTLRLTLTWRERNALESELNL